MDNMITDIGFTGQRLGSSEPVGSGSVREGSCRSSTSDFPESCVGNQAQTQDITTGIGINLERNQNEQDLYNAWIHEKQEREKLQSIVQQLQEQIKILQSKSAHTTLDQEDKGQKSYEEYHTDEEELSKETEWIRVKNTHKKRKASTSPCEAVLPSTSSINKPYTQQNNHIVKRKPPPVIISKINNYEKLMDRLSNDEIEFQATMMAGEKVKLNTNDEKGYRKLTQVVKDMKVEWYSFENKQSRPIKVVVRNLHQTCRQEIIKMELVKKGLKILEVHQIIRRKDKVPLPLFILTFSKDEDIKKIYEIKEIFHMRVIIEALRKPKLIPQCKNCQEYGHTQKYCGRDPRCVKCAGKHHTRECKKPPNIKAKCIHCGEAHPANYRGCSTAIALQEMRNKANSKKKKKTEGKRLQDTLNIRTVKPKEVENSVTYAEIVNAAHQKPETSIEHIAVILQEMMNQMEQQQQKQEKCNKNILDRISK